MKYTILVKCGINGTEREYRVSGKNEMVICDLFTKPGGDELLRITKGWGNMTDFAEKLVGCQKHTQQIKFPWSAAKGIDRRIQELGCAAEEYCHWWE